MRGATSPAPEITAKPPCAAAGPASAGMKATAAIIEMMGHRRFRSEQKPLPHRQRREPVLAEGFGQRRHRSPAGAVTRGDDSEIEWLHRLDRLRDDLFIAPGKMQAAQ